MFGVAAAAMLYGLTSCWFHLGWLLLGVDVAVVWLSSIGLKIVFNIRALGFQIELRYPEFVIQEMFGLRPSRTRWSRSC